MQCARYSNGCLSSRNPFVSKDMTKRLASQKKLVTLPGGARFNDGGGGMPAPAMPPKGEPVFGGACPPVPGEVFFYRLIPLFCSFSWGARSGADVSMRPTFCSLFHVVMC